MRYIKLLICFLLTFFFFNKDCFASVNTYTRTNSNLLVPKDVVVDENNINSILSTNAVSSSEKIYDYAELFTDSEEKEVFSKIMDYVNKTKIDVAFVTTKNLNGFSIVDYAYNFYDYNDFLNDGVIFVIYITDTEPEIYMGNSGVANDIYTHDRINQTLSFVYKNINTGNYNTAIGDYIKILDGFYDIDGKGNYLVDKEGKVKKSIPWLEIVILAGTLTFIIIVLLIYLLKNKKKYKKNFSKNIDSNTLVIKMDDEKVIN